MKIGNQEFDIKSLIGNLHSSTEIDINKISKEFQAWVNVFDENNDKKLSSAELKNMLSIFEKMDKNQDGALSDAELENGMAANKINTGYAGVKEQKKFVVEMFAKILANDLNKQIEGMSLNKNTIDRLKKINPANVYTVLREYNSLDKGKSLVKDIMAEWTLPLVGTTMDANTVKDYICKPLVKHAKNLGLQVNESEYQDLNTPKDLDEFVNTTMKKIQDYYIKYKPTVVDKDVNGKHVHFEYNKTLIEEYVINDAKASDGHIITYFKRIPEIREKSPANRNDEENKLLEEFDPLVKNIITAGEEYGVDPKFIFAIVQREVCFKGLNQLSSGKKNNVTGANGKGYTQITSITIVDILGGQRINGKNVYKTDANNLKKYGPEMEQLLKSKGFNPSCKKEQKQAEFEKIWQYIKDNEDPEFNIRFGTLLLRYHLRKSNGNIEIAARNYNGSDHKIAYGKAVDNFYNTLCDKQIEFCNKT